MAVVKGMKGLRYSEKAGDINSLICPPYDIISDKQREEYLAENPYNIVRLELPKGENRYADAGKTLNEWVNDGILVKDEKPSIYVYEMEFEAYGQTKKVKGFVGLTELVDFSEGVVLPHEETLSKAKEDRFNLMKETYSNFSQIYALYNDNGEIFSLINSCSQGEPTTEAVDADKVIHRLWKVSDEKIVAEITEKFADKKLYIADGHHRYETALNFRKYLLEKGLDCGESIMMMLVDMENDGLVVFPTHRIVRDLKDFDADSVIEKCKEYFSTEDFTDSNAVNKKLEELYNNGEKAFALYKGNGKFTVLTLKDKSAVKKFMPEKSDAYCGLDVSVLHTLILERILGIDKENMAQQINLTYTKIFDEAIETVDSGKANCSFILNPTKVSEIRDVALAGEKMPQKSTYFYPKMTTGLVMNKFN